MSAELRDIERYEQDYLDNPFEAELIRYRHRKTLETLQKYRPARILEVGCGLQPLYQYFDRFDELVIFEPSSQFAELARAEAPSGVTVVTDELGEKYGEYEDRFDLIVVSSLLHELEEPLALLKTVKAFAIEDGIVHINVPNANSLHRLLAVRMGLVDSVYEKSPRQVKYQQHHTFDQERLSDLAYSADLEIIFMETFFVKPFTHAQMQQLIDSGFLTQEMLDGLYQLSKDLPDLGAEIVMNARVKR